MEITAAASVPPEFAEVLRRERESGDARRLNALLAAAHRVGWPYPALAGSLGVSSATIRVRILSSASVPDLPPVPQPPGRRSGRPKRPGLTPDLIEELRELRAMADSARDAGRVAAAGDPADQRYCATPAAYIDQSLSYSYLAGLFGTNPSRILSPVKRHRRRHPAPSTAVAGEQAMPAEFAQMLRQERESGDARRLGTLLAVAQHTGWKERVLGNALGLSGERIRQLVMAALPVADLPPCRPRRTCGSRRGSASGRS